jgi:hypothetical protein
MRHGGNGERARAKWRASPVSESVAHMALGPSLQLLPRERPTFVWSRFRVKHAVLNRFQPAVSIFANKNHIGGPLLSGGVFRNGSEGRVFYNTNLFTRAISKLPADGTWFGVPQQVGVLFRLLSPDLGTARRRVNREEVCREHVRGKLVNAHCDMTTDFTCTVHRRSNSQTGGTAVFKIAVQGVKDDQFIRKRHRDI